MAKEKIIQHSGHNIIIPEKTGPRPRVLIDGKPYEYGQDAAGKYFLRTFAYNRKESLLDVVKCYLDSQSRIEKKEN